MVTRPAFSFSVSAVSGVVALALFFTGHFLPMISFIAGSISFALIGLVMILLDRAIKNGMDL
ncbi:MAG: hypothetical protein ACXWBP_12145 [Limisphaerales bacterium]